MNIITKHIIVNLMLAIIGFSETATGQTLSHIAAPVYESRIVSTSDIGISIIHSFSMDFGNDLLPGVDRMIYPIDPVGRGAFQIEGEGGLEVSVSFILPDYLSDGLSQLPVSFSGDYAGYGTNPMGNSLTLFNPQTGLQMTLSSMPNYIFIGGRAMPPSFLASGTYTGTITIQVEYTGN